MRQSELKKFIQSIFFQFSVAFLTVITLVLFILNIFTFSASRDMLRTEMEDALREQARQLASSLSEAEAFDEGNISRAAEALSLPKRYWVLVVDRETNLLYSSDRTQEPTTDLISSIHAANAGETVFQFDFSDNVIIASVAMPITTAETRLGAVCLYWEEPEGSGAFNITINNLQRMTILLGVASAFAILIISQSFATRIGDLVQATRRARGGDYEQRVPLAGNDELTDLGMEFNQLMERLQKTEEVRRRFVTDASHELKTPLTTIILLADSILQTETMTSETRQEFIGDIMTEAGRLRQITENLLNLTRLDAVREPGRTPVDMGQTLRDAAHTLTPLAEQSEISLLLQLSEEPCMVLADAEDITRVVYNLVENAIKYNRRGGQVVMRLDPVKDEVRLEVEDTGIGIPEAEVPHIFSRFYRVDKHRARASGGSGLGLSIVHDALARNNGRIEVDSQEHFGTRFTIYLPAAS